MERKYLMGRVRWVENYADRLGEHFLYEIKWNDQDEWCLDAAVPIINDLVHYTAVTILREWAKRGVVLTY